MKSPLPLPETLPHELLRQHQLVHALCARGYFPNQPEVEETHISWVLLTGRDAYKIKKAVNLGFLDFSSSASPPVLLRRGTSPQPAPRTRTLTST